MRKLFLAVCVALCGMTVNAASIDCTNLVDETWGNTSACDTQFAPAVTPSGYSSSVQMRENYQDNVNATGVLISQTLTGLTIGTYTVELYANAFYTSGRGFTSDMKDGATDVAYVFANDQTTPVTAKIASLTTENGEYSITVTVTDGTLKIGIGKWKAGTNWHTIQIKSLTREATAQDAYEAALATAKVLDLTQPMNANVKSAMETALTTYGTASSDTYETATNALIEATNNVNASVTAYATLKTSIDYYANKATALDSDGQAAYKTAISTIETSYTSGTYTDTEAKGSAIESLASAYREAVASQTTAGTDMSDVLINPDFENGFTGWTYTDGMWTQYNGNLTQNYVEKWASSASSIGEASVKQSITLNEGYYTLKAQVVARNLSAELYVKVGDETIKVETDGSEQSYYSLDFHVTDANTTVEVGYLTDGTIENYSTGDGWFAIDNVSLNFVVQKVDETTISELIAKVPSGIMNKEVEATLTSAKSALETNKTVENYVALSNAIVAANASIEAYKTSRASLDEATTFFNETWKGNVYEQSILTNYETEYTNRTLTDALTYTSGRESTGVIEQMLLSGWSNTGTANGDLYINTWSEEGKNDGSEFVTPFFEAWVPSGTLAAKSYEKTISGLTAGETYTISAWVRVQSSDTPSGITMQVGDKSVEVSGTQIGSSQLYMDTYSVTGTADTDGNLTLKFVVAEGNNISWLSFKNVKISTTVTITERGKVADNEYYATYVTTMPTDLSQCDFTAYSVTTSGKSLTYTKQEGIVPAGTPLVICGTEAKDYEVVGSAEEGTKIESNDLKVATSETVGDGSTTYILENKDNVVGWYLCSKNGKINEKKCYLIVENAAGVKFFGLDGIASGISSVSAEQSNSNARYNLSGQRVNKGYKGIVIENGKKYLLK